MVASLKTRAGTPPLSPEAAALAAENVPVRDTVPTGACRIMGFASGIPVLCYHDLMLPAQKARRRDAYVLTTVEFDRQMAILHSAGYKTVGLDELKQYIRRGGNCSNKVLLTFDDGYKSAAWLAAPILRKYGYRAVFFLIAKSVDGPDLPLNTKNFYPFQGMSAADLKRFSDVLAYGSHTYNLHINLKNDTQSDKIEKDLILSRQKLGGTAAFAYPLGEYDGRVEGLLYKAGFTMAFTLRRQYVHRGENLLEIPRIEILSPTTDAQFDALMDVIPRS